MSLPTIAVSSLRRWLLSSFGLLLGLFCLGGCSGNPNGASPVQGKVLYEGKPTPGAFLVFHPRNAPPAGEQPIRPSARVGEDGSFRISTFGTNDGAPPGEYLVNIEWRPLIQKGPDDVTVGPNVLPPRYAKPETSGLLVFVVEGLNELPPFQLRD